MNKNKKGFALVEILAVTVVVMIIFAFLYGNFLPLKGEYNKRVAYTDVESEYINFYMRKLYKDKTISLGSKGYDVLYNNTNKVCKLLSGTEKSQCEDLAEKAGVEVLVVTTSNIEKIKSNKDDVTIDSIRDYIQYLPNFNKDNPTEMYRLIVKTSTGFATTELKLDMSKYTPTNVLSSEKLTNAIKDYKANVLTISTRTSNSVPSGAVYSADVSAKGDGSVKIWLTRSSTDSSKYDMYLGANGVKVILPEDSKYLFSSYTAATSINLSNVDTSKVTNMNNFFAGNKLVTSLNISSFNTSKVTSMSGMFDENSALTSLNLSAFDTSNVTDMGVMFSDCSKLTSLNVTSFNTSKVTDMGFMFHGCGKLTSLNVSNFDTRNVTDMRGMFASMSSIVSLDLSSFNTSKVTNMWGMFSVNEKMQSVNVSSFNTSNVTDMGYMFSFNSELQSLNLSNFNTSNVTDMQAMFQSCYKLTSLDLRSFNTGKVKNMWAMFQRMTSLTYLNVTSFNTSSVTNMSSMFNQMSSLTSLNLSSFDTSNVTTMSGMFGSSSALTSLDLTSFNTSKVTNMNNMFSYTSSLGAIYVSSSKWNTSNATTTDMFDSSGVSSVTYR